MDDFLTHVFSVALSPFTSDSMLVWVPAGFAFIYGCVSLVFHFLRRF